MTQSSSGRITIEQAHDALNRSGYLLESRLAAYLRKSQFRVVVNGTYPDPETGKGRELDIWASYAMCWPTGPGNTDNLSLEIVAECINPPQPLAFITRSWPSALFEVGDRWDALKIGGDPLHVPLNELATNWSWLGHTLRMERYHHYATKRIATQYCSFEKKKGLDEWMAKHRDEDHTAFRKLCDATTHYQRALFTTLEQNDHCGDVFLHFVYPVLVVQGELLEVRADRKLTEVTAVPHIQYHCTQLYDGRPQEFQIDVVTEEYFPAFLDLLGGDTDKTVTRMKRHHAKVCEMLAARIDNQRRYGRWNSEVRAPVV